MSTRSTPSSPSQPLRRAILKFALLAVLLGGGFVLFRFTRLAELLSLDHLIASLQTLRGTWWTAPALIALFAVFASLGAPASIFIITGGAVFGTFWGWIYNLLGALLASAASHWLARSLGRDLIAHTLGEERVKRIEGIIDTHGFWTMVRVRFVPIPFVAVNFGAALAGMPLGRFLAATAIGLTPSLFAMTYFVSALVGAAEGDRSHLVWQLALVMFLFLALSFIPTLLRRRSRAATAEPTSGDPEDRPGAGSSSPPG